MVLDFRISIVLFVGRTLDHSTRTAHHPTKMSGSSATFEEKKAKTSTFVADYTPEEIKKAHQVLYNEGLRMRIKVNGEQYVEKALQANKDAFARPMQEV